MAMRSILAILGRVVVTVLLVGAVAAAAYAVGHATRKDPGHLDRVLAASSKPKAPAHAAPASRRGAPKHRHAAGPRRPVDRRRVVVAVLNATTAPGVARTASDTLTAAGFARGAVTNDGRTRSATKVLYAPGNRDGALDVAKVLRIGGGAVRSIDGATRALAGTGAAVVVSVGSDRAQPPGR
ncbi:MAG: LytR cell envelope-related transcriptional attenuator [Solirubrobacteraceae bacterium]|jgi:hypothetical protein|nr:LytR cell envelope-related transcriptional attenuator [Solirubrobacteraceae bacterium]